MTRTLVCVCSVFSLVLFLSSAVFAAGPHPEKLTVVYTEWYPYTYREGNSAKGFEIEVFTAVINRMGIEAAFERFPFGPCPCPHIASQDPGAGAIHDIPGRTHQCFPDRSFHQDRKSDPV
jgi:hypothetical protein